MTIDYDELLQKVLQHEKYRHFTEELEPGIFRPKKKGDNSSPEQLTKQGYFNHLSGERVSLFEIGKELDLLPQLPKRTRKKKTPADIYNESVKNNKIVKAYFNGRAIDITDQVIDEIGIRVWKDYKKNNVVIVPMRSPSGELVQITRIELDENFKKVSKKLTGSGDQDRGVLLKKSDTRVAIFEGIEDGLSYYFNAPNQDSVLVCFGTAGFSKITGFVDLFQNVGAFLDNDSHGASLKASKKLPDKVVRLIPTTEPGLDCNAALQAGRFDEWFKSTEKVENNRDQLEIPENTGIGIIQIHEWPHLKIYGQGAGKEPASTIENLQFLLDRLGIQVRYNVIAKDLEIYTPDSVYGAFDGGKNAAINAIISECCRCGMPKGDVPQYLGTIGHMNQYNPVLEWIKSRPYDHDLNYVEMMCETVQARVDFDPSFKNLLIKKWLLSCVAMLCNDDARSWSKGVLTFQGPQDLGKTSWFWKLFPEDHQEWGKEGVVLKPDEKDSVTAAITHWIIELGELEATFKKSDIARIKAFLTNRKDKIRLPYDRKESIFPRRTSFFASVNPSQFLRDNTGNVRFWVIPVTDINYKHEIDIQQMWAQLYEIYQRGKSWHLESEESKQLEIYNENAREMSGIEEMIIRYDFGRFEMTATEVLSKLGYERPSKSDVNEAANVLRKIYGDPIRRKDGRFYQMVTKC